MSKTDVTVLGIGSMGHALAAAFLANGHRVTVWNRTPGKADDLVAQGAIRANDPKEAVEASPVVVACVLDYPALHGVLDGSWDALAGRTLINLTNGTPAHARETAKLHDGEYVDGGIMAVPPMIGGPGALVLYSGSQAAFERYEDLLGELGATHFLGEDAGMAALIDLALLSGMYGMFGGVAHSVALAASGGLDPAEYTTTLLAPWLVAMTGLLNSITDDSPADMQVIAFGNIVAASNEQGVDPELLSHLTTPLRQMIGPDAAGLSLKEMLNR